MYTLYEYVCVVYYTMLTLAMITRKLLRDTPRLVCSHTTQI